MAQISGWIDILPLGLSKVRYRTTGGRVERRERAGRRERARRERGTKERSFVPIFLLISFIYLFIFRELSRGLLTRS